MKKISLILAVAVLVLYSCGSGNKKENSVVSTNVAPAVSGSIIIEGSETLYLLMCKWKQEFEKSQANVKISIKPSSSDMSLKKISDNKIQIAMISRKLGANEEKSGFWAVPVAKDAVLPVISFDNNNLQKIVLAGVSKDKLAAAFLGKITTWGQLLQIKSADPIEVYRIADSSGTSKTWAEFLNANPRNFIGKMVGSEKNITYEVASNKNGIGYSSMTNIYDIKTGFIKKNVYVLPIDLNSNNQADDNELVFDKLDDIKSAISSGKYPSPPVRKIYLVCKSVPTDAATVTFIKWILTIGQSYCGQFGFVNIEQKEAAEFLKQLK
jgi:ABC-type phosphate transport system substrate-binding protein